jgi:hypothetical protein
VQTVPVACNSGNSKHRSVGRSVVGLHTFFLNPLGTLDIEGGEERGCGAPPSRPRWQPCIL